MKLAVCNSFWDKKSAIFWNKDGFLKMLDVLQKRDGWEITFFKYHATNTFTWEHDYVKLSFSPDVAKQVLDYKPDAVLFFDNFSSPLLAQLEGRGIPIAVCFTGGKYNNYANIPDIVFTESKSYIEWMKSVGVKRVVQAFGTNTEVFKPIKQSKVFDAYFPATGAAWKRHWLFAEAMKDKGLVSGWWQPHEPQCLQVCIDNGTPVLHHQMPDSVNYLYNMSHTVVITSEDVGGSQRAVLEALACNIPTIVMEDSTMTSEYIRECGVGEIVNPNIHAIREAVEKWKGKSTNSREWIMNTYTEYHYANKVKEGIESIL